MDSERSRRSIASQYFMDEDSTTADMAEGINTSDRVIDLINQTHLLTKDSQKIANLKHVQELIVHKDPTLLDNFLDEVLQFQHDKSADVRKFVVGFIEEACKKDNDMLCSVIPHLNMMLSDSAQHVAVIKKVILCSMQLYKIALKWLVNARTFGEEMEAVWDQIQEIKRKVFIMLDSENDGIRTHSTKYMESLILVESARVAGSEIPKKPEADISLDQIPEEHGLLKREELEKDGLHAFELLLDLLASPSITSVNLMACMGSLTTIAKQRPQFMARVIQAFETLHVNLPPTLAKSQVSSVRKHLKMQLLNLLKHPSSVSLHPNITTLLTDLGASEAEISKHMPKVRESFKRPRPADDEGSSNSKKPKTATVKTIQQVMDEDEMGRETPLHPTLLPSMPSTSKATIQAPAKISVVDLLAEELTPLLQNVENVANLVLISMVTLPETMPPQFQASYTPIAAAGTDSQISHLARMMSSQFATAGIKPQNMEMLEQEEEAADKENKSAVTQKPTGIPVLGEAEEDTGRKKSGLSFQAPVGVPKPRARMKQFKLSDVTVPLEQMVANKLVSGAVSRIITSEKMSQQGGASQARIKILVGLVSQFSGDLFPMLKDHVLEDLRSRSELAFAWLYQEYSSYQGYMPRYLDQEVSMNRYDKLLCAMLMALLDRPDQRDGLFTRLVMEAPVITERAVKVIRKFCEDETHFFTGMHALRELILKRPADIQRYLQELLELTFHERTEVRSQATQYVKRLYERQDLKETIEEFASKCLHYLLSDVPNPSLVSRTSEGGEGGSDWTEASIKLCLHLYLALLPSNHKLIHELATVYVATSALIKRTVLRVLEAPVRGMGMSSPELLLLVENCPKGAETLVTRMLHILTDKAPPSQDLVKRVRDLYLKRVSDVRFLIPVLIGLEKKEVIAALPKLIKLNPIVVKEVFHRLLMSHQGDNSAGQSPLTPAELLIALHNIDTSKCDIKSIIKATSLCFNEKAIYTQEVLAVVMQQLMEQGTVPTLLMRTVIQSLGMYPRLSGFVMNILQRLIVKQVWNLPKVWEGFVKCCERTKPQSFQVLLQLPAEQLKNVFEMSPDMRAPMLAHVQTFTPHQQAHIPPPIMTVLETDPLAERKKMEEEERKKREEELRIKMEAEEKQKEEERLLQEKLAEERRKQEQLKKEAAEKAAKEKAEKLKAQREAEEKKRKEAEEKLARERQEKMRAEQEASLKAAREAGERVAREARERREKREAAREAGIKAAMEAKEKKEKMEAEERARRQEEQQKAALARQEEMEKKKQEEEQKKQEEIKRKEEEALKREEEERRQQEELKSRQEEENKKREEETLKQEEEKIRQEVEAEKKRQEELEAERRIKEQIQEDQEMQEMVTVKQEPDELKEFEAAAHQEMPLKIKQEKPDQEAQEATVDTEFKIKKEVEDYPEQEAVENPFQETVEDESQSSNPVASAELESEDTGDGSVQSEMPSPAGRGRGRGRGGRGRGRGAKKTATPSPSGTRKSTRKKN